MTIDEQRIKVLEWMGWTNIHMGFTNPDYANENIHDKELVGIHPINKHQPPHISLWKLPPLTLDWVHECVAKLKPEQHSKFLRELVIITETHMEVNTIESVMKQVNATAEQRLVALVETIKEK